MEESTRGLITISKLKKSLITQIEQGIFMHLFLPEQLPHL